METTSTCKRISDAIARLQNAETHLNAILQETKEIVEQIALLDRLPTTLNMQQNPNWHPRLASKLRQKASDCEARIKEISQTDVQPCLECLSLIHEQTAVLSATFRQDLKLLIGYYKHILILTSEDALRRRSVIRERSFEEDCSLKRLKIMSESDNKEQEYLGGRDSVVFKNVAENDEPLPIIRETFHKDFLEMQNKGASSSLLTTMFDPSSFTTTEDLTTIFPYTSEFVTCLFHNRHVALIGDSLTRAIYKDLVRMLQTDDLLSPDKLKAKSEPSHLGDRLIDALPLNAGKVFRQAREYCTDVHLIQYLFTTRVMKEDVEKFLLQCEETGEHPDVLVLNSALWDLTRYYDHDTDMTDFEAYQDNPISQLNDETDAMREYMERISLLMRRLRVVLPPHTQVIWLLMPWPMPEGESSIFSHTAGQRKLHRSIYLDGNYRAAQIVSSAGFDVLDIGFYLRNHSLYPLRVQDGVHWSSVGTRLMTQLLIGHLAGNLSELPDDIKARLKKCVAKCNVDETGEKLNYTYYTETGQNVRGSEGEQEVHEPYFNQLQRDMREQIYDDIPEEITSSIAEDVQICRVMSLMQEMELQLDECDEQKLYDEARQFPRVKKHVVDYMPQIIEKTNNI